MSSCVILDCTVVHKMIKMSPAGMNPSKLLFSSDACVPLAQTPKDVRAAHLFLGTQDSLMACGGITFYFSCHLKTIASLLSFFFFSILFPLLAAQRNQGKKKPPKMQYFRVVLHAQKTFPVLRTVSQLT